LALRTMPIPARVERHGFVRTVVTLLDAGAKRRGLACADVPEDSELVIGKYPAPLFEELPFVLAKDIGDFEPMLRHLCRLSSLPRIGARWRASKGLGTAVSSVVETRK